MQDTQLSDMGGLQTHHNYVQQAMSVVILLHPCASQLEVRCS